MIQLNTFNTLGLYSLLIILITSCYPKINVQQTSQDPLAFINDTTYFDANWNTVLPISSYAKYYRTFERIDGELFVHDHYLSNNQIQNRGKVFAVDPLRFQGMVLWYHENGNLSRKAIYQAGIITGDEIVYYPTGNPKDHYRHEKGERLIIQLWSEEGVEWLNNGAGSVTRLGEGNILTEHMVIKNNQYVEYYTVRKNEMDTVYSHVETPAEYSGGMRLFYQNIAREMNYPTTARQQGIQGNVYIQFLITQKGELTEAKITKGIGGGCDEEALRAIKSIKGWNPAIHKGKKVTTRMVLPVIFKLT